jgi:formiminotetrahydrofolate cyclodeaminase
MYTELPVDAFLEQLASSAPEPGGGAAAALVAATGAALVSMVANLTVGKTQYAAVGPEMEQARVRADALRAELVAAVDQDAAVFRRVMAAYALPRATEEEKAARRQATQQALKEASRVPAQVVRLCREVAALGIVTTQKGNVQAVSDAAIAALLADSAAQSAALNVKINLKLISDPGFNDPLWAEIQGALETIRATRDEALRITAERMG